MAEFLFQITEPGRTPRELRVVDGLTIGRNADNGCVLDDPKVSGNHARIVKVGNELTIEDCGSSNGTIVDDGRRLAKGERQALRDGQKLRIGYCDLLVKSAAPAVPKTRLLELPEAATTVPAGGAAAADKAKPPAAKPAPAEEKPKSAAEKPAPAAAKPAPAAESPKPAAKPAAPPAKPAVDPGYAKTVMRHKTDPDGSEARTSQTSIPVDPIEDALGNEKTVAHRVSSDDFPNLERTTDAQPVQPVPPKKPAAKPAAQKPAPAKPAPAKPETASQEGIAPTVISKPINRADVLAKEAAAREAEMIARTVARAQSPVKDAEEARTVQSPPISRERAAKADPAPAPAKPAAAGADQATLALPMMQSGGAEGVTGDAEVLRRMRARIVFEDPKFRASVPIEKSVFSIGRRRTSVQNDVDFEIDHPTVSSRHAVIKLKLRHFVLEDLGAKNGNAVDGRQLRMMKDREIRPDSTLRFGVVDALFVCDCDRDLKPLNREAVYERALEYLVAKDIIKAKQRSAIPKGAHPGEYLLLQGHCSVSHWAQALKAIEAAGFVGKSESRIGGLKLIAALGVLIALILTLVYFLMPDLFK